MKVLVVTNMDDLRKLSTRLLGLSQKTRKVANLDKLEKARGLLIRAETAYLGARRIAEEVEVDEPEINE